MRWTPVPDDPVLSNATLLNPLRVVFNATTLVVTNIGLTCWLPVAALLGELQIISGLREHPFHHHESTSTTEPCVRAARWVRKLCMTRTSGANLVRWICSLSTEAAHTPPGPRKCLNPPVDVVTLQVVHSIAL